MGEFAKQNRLTRGEAEKNGQRKGPMNYSG